MKILQINKLYYPWIGGVEKTAQNISEGLKNHFDISVLCCQEKGKTKKERINGVNVLRASSFGVFWGMPFSFSFFKLFKESIKKVDIISYHYPFPLADLAIFLFKPKAKIIVYYHSDIVRQKILNFLIRPLTLNTLSVADKIIVSNSNMIESSPYLSKFKEKCKVVYHGINLKKFQKVNRKQQEKIIEKYGEFVLYVGRLSYYKGINYLIKAVKDIDANLVIIGEGPQKNSLKKEIKKLGIEEKIFFLSFLPKQKLINFYRASKLFILPSIYKSETFGLVLLEAMACGTPVISTEIGTGTSFVNKSGETGLVVSPKNSKEISFAINKILNNKEVYKKMCVNAKRRVQQLFSLEKMLEKIKEIYNKL